MYTDAMQKTSANPRWWDWISILVLFVIVETGAARLVATRWTEFLYLGQTVVFIAFIVGVSLGYSQFPPRAARWISFGYMVVHLPLQWALMIDQSVSLEEQLASLGGRLFRSYADFFARQPVEDPILFITLVTFVFWVIAASAGFQLVRRQSYLAAVTPSGIILLVIQNYDDTVPARAWMIAFFAFMALLLLGRLHHLASRQTWREKHIFLSPDNSMDLTSIMTVAAALLILISWTPPASLASLESAAQTWNKATQPWRDFTKRMENAVTALKGSRGAGELYGPELPLGNGFEFNDTVMFIVRVPDIPSAVKPPRYYWKGRTYDHYENGQWYTTDSTFEDYSPNDPVALSAQTELASARFVFRADQPLSLIYAPNRAVWMSRQGARLRYPAEGGEEIVSWFADPILLAGETYQVEAALANPNMKQLREAGTVYPDWVKNRYLQLPGDFSVRVRELALDVTDEAETPFDKAVALTKYLRENITYTDVVSNAPRNRDPLEWMLFENKQGYCVYYASAEVLMLRSLGIPARLAAGFAEGQFVQEQGEYIVRRENAHAWPEVYFPGIGWVEFEPTGNQLALNRPAAPDSQLTNNAASTRPLSPDDTGSNRDELLGEPLEDEAVAPVETTNAPASRLYLLFVFLVLAGLAVYFSIRYSIAGRIPAMLRAACERNGLKTPAWILDWEGWMNTSPTGRAFESVNFSLRLLGKPLPAHATPIERARELENLLPRASNDIHTLLDEHQTSLYTSREADVLRARRAAFRIRRQALVERIGHILEGKSIRSP